MGEGLPHRVVVVNSRGPSTPQVSADRPSTTILRWVVVCLRSRPGEKRGWTRHWNLFGEGKGSGVSLLPSSGSIESPESPVLSLR